MGFEVHDTADAAGGAADATNTEVDGGTDDAMPNNDASNAADANANAGADADADARADADADADAHADADADADAGAGDADGGQGPLPGRRAWTAVAVLDKPPPLARPALAYDEARKRIVLFGGIRAQTSMASAALWEYDGTTWTEMCDPCDPGTRVGHGLVYDRARAKVVMIGGLDQGGVAHNDVWTWDGTAWDLEPATGEAPDPIAHFGMVYDPSGGRILVVGGDTSTGASNEMFELIGSAWHRLQVEAGVDGPLPARISESNALVWDDATRTLYIVGGTDTLGMGMDDLWKLDAAGGWSRVCEICSGTPARARAAIWDPARARIVVVGGFTLGGELTGTFEFQGDHFITVDATTPPARDSVGLAYDSDRDVIVTYGGNGDCPEQDCDDTFEFRR
ncbi:MAG: hypothetical protein H6729_15160 [Deltaproteobacteria bacterium]|nr:hypothetical protein [Deltaproteobacteria bacterium]